MKHGLFFASMALIMWLAACSGEKANNQQNAEQVVQQVEDSATVIGKWTDANQKGFEAGDTIHIITAADTTTFAMQFSGSQLTLTDKEGKQSQYTRQK